MKLEQVPTPAYVIDLAKLEANCRILQYVQEEAGCKVLLAQKAYSLYKTYPLISQYLSGTTASGLYELSSLEKSSREKSMYLRLLSRMQTWRNCWR